MSFNNVQSLATDGTNLFAGTNQIGVYHSSNGGASWLQGLTGLTSGNIQCLAVIGSNLFAGSDMKVSVSTNAATSFSAINNGFTSTNVHALITTGNTLFAGTGGPGVFMTADNGANWMDVTTGLSTNTDMNAFTILGGNIYVGSNGAGVWKRPMSELVTGTVPASPSNLTVLPQKTEVVGEMLLGWSDNSSDETGFGIERSIDGTSFTSLGSVAANVSTYTDMGLSAGQTYYYRVYAFNSAGNSSFSNTASSTATYIPSIDANSSINIYPNPASDNITVELSNYQDASVEITNLQGQTIYRNLLQAKTNQLNTNNIPSGVYVLKVNSKEGTTMWKLIKN